MDIDYEKAFKKLVEQIKLETKWAKEEYKREHPEGLRIPTQKSTRGCTVHQFWIEMSVFGIERYDKGMMAAYGSIEELAIKLENGTFFNEENKKPEMDLGDYPDITEEQYEHDIVNDCFV